MCVPICCRCEAQSPTAEIVFALVLAGSLREMVRNYVLQANSFKLRDELFEQIAVARTYGAMGLPPEDLFRFASPRRVSDCS